MASETLPQKCKPFITKTPLYLTYKHSSIIAPRMFTPLSSKSSIIVSWFPCKLHTAVMLIYAGISDHETMQYRQQITVADVHANTYAGDGFHEPFQPLDSDVVAV
eukprot:scaffold6264_cov73-Skeletonema_marinoi.AAC.6